MYEALNELIGGRVAIKILNADCAREEELVARFFNEARAVNLIDHPSLVKVMHHGRLDGGKPYLVMEFLSGQTLDDRIVERGGRLSEAEAARIIHQVALALSATHAAEIVHRDLKPANIPPVGYWRPFVRAPSEWLRTKSLFSETAEGERPGLSTRVQPRCYGIRRAAAQVGCGELRAGA